ncbi:MAG: hypothetical protein ABWY45_19765 [Mycobacterium sp.]
MTRVAFTGHIAGFGSGAGVRMVVGVWQDSPFGSFADVMVQTADNRRLLLAPSQEVAEFVSATYSFDDIQIGPVVADLQPGRLTVTAAELDVTVELAGPAPVDWLLRWVPKFLATAPWWLRLIDPIASRVLPGVHTAGSAGNGRREFYGVRRSRRIGALSGQFRGTPLGGLAELSPPVAFGFSSAPPLPQLVSVTTTIFL